jgi:hypothetical protein
VTGLELLAEHVDRFNAAVGSGDFGPMLELFTDDAALEFVGVPVGPFEGREAIAAAYREQPPDDESRCSRPGSARTSSVRSMRGGETRGAPPARCG